MIRKNMRIVNGKIEYEIVDNDNKTVRIFYLGNDLTSYVTTVLNGAKLLVTDLFNQNRRGIIIPQEINIVCNDVFDAIKLVKQRGDEELAAYLAARLFESFTPYWIALLSDGKDLVGIYLWKAVLRITAEWENKNGIKIHTGTPNFFLSENYFLIGDRDVAFVYLYDALEDDKLLNKSAPVFEYPLKAPASYTATMNPNKGNHMYYIVKELRDRLEEYISKFNSTFNSNFSIYDFDNKFRLNGALGDVVSYFVYNFIFLLTIEKNTEARSLDNDFSRLRSLDLFFNFCLVIDEALKVLYSSTMGARSTGQRMIAQSIIWFCCNQKRWITESELTQFWGQSGLNLNDLPPDSVIPRLLAMNESWNNRPIPKELHPFLIVYKFRNYGGHSISQQQIISKEYAKILENLMFALFFVIMEMPKPVTTS